MKSFDLERFHPNVREDLKKDSIEIVGGGIAGLSLAVGLRTIDVPVTLREAGSYPRHRLCGEFVNGVSDETLRALGLQGLFEGAQEHVGMSWWAKGEKVAEAELEHPVRALSRWEVDRRMSEMFIERGGSLVCRERVPCEPQSGRVWAAGRKLQKGTGWLGLKAHFIGLEICSGLEMHLGDGGYVGLTPVEGGRVNVCGLFRQREGLAGNGSERFLSYLNSCGLNDLVSRLREAEVDEASLTGVSGIGFGAQGQDSKLLALGDAERMIPPFTGNGMSMAFESSECALDALNDYSCGDMEWEEASSLIRARLQRRFQRRIMLAKGLHRLILNSSAQDVLAALAKPGLLPFTFLNRLLT